METVFNAVIFTVGQGFAFNVVLPIFYIIIKMMGI